MLQECLNSFQTYSFSSFVTILRLVNTVTSSSFNHVNSLCDVRVFCCEDQRRYSVAANLLGIIHLFIMSRRGPCAIAEAPVVMHCFVFQARRQLPRKMHRVLFG